MNNDLGAAGVPGHHAAMQPFELRGGGILLAVPTADDVDAITALCQDAEIQQWTTTPVPYQRAHAEEFVRLVEQGWANGSELTWAIRNPEDRSVLGMIGLTVDHHGSGEIGYWLAEEGRGRGLMTTAVRLVAEFAFAPEGLGLQRMLWSAYVGNWASRRVAWRLGFRFEGTVRAHLLQRGRRRDAWLATLVAGDPMEPVGCWLDVPVLTGAAVTLRRFEESDAEACAEACNDPVTRHWLGGLPRPYSRENALRHIRSREEDHAAGVAVHWAAAPPGGGPAIGAFSLMGLDRLRESGGGEVGYWVHPGARGKGVATEALRLLVRHAFTPSADGGLGLRRLTLGRAEGNEASATVAERAGFRECGVEHAAERLGDGTFADLHRYELLR